MLGVRGSSCAGVGGQGIGGYNATEGAVVAMVHWVYGEKWEFAEEGEKVEGIKQNANSERMNVRAG